MNRFINEFLLCVVVATITLIGCSMVASYFSPVKMSMGCLAVIWFLSIFMGMLAPLKGEK